MIGLGRRCSDTVNDFHGPSGLRDRGNHKFRICLEEAGMLRSGKMFCAESVAQAIAGATNTFHVNRRRIAGTVKHGDMYICAYGHRSRSILSNLITLIYAIYSRSDVKRGHHSEHHFD